MGRPLPGLDLRSLGFRFHGCETRDVRQAEKPAKPVLAVVILDAECAALEKRRRRFQNSVSN